MKRNIGTVDRVVRLGVGVPLLSLLAVGPIDGWGLIGLVGIVLVVTGAIGYCPSYELLGIDTLATRIRRTRQVEPRSIEKGEGTQT